MSGDPTDPRILRPPGWPRPSGYSDGMMVTGRLIFLAGQIGWDPRTAQFVSNDMTPQVEQALRNIAALLSHAGAEPRHLVRLTWFVTDRVEYMAARQEIGLVYRRVMGSHYPPMSVVVVNGLAEMRAKVEIEATAVLPMPE